MFNVKKDDMGLNSLFNVSLFFFETDEQVQREYIHKEDFLVSSPLPSLGPPIYWITKTSRCNI